MGFNKKRRAKPQAERVFRVAYVANKLDKEPEHKNLVLADLLEQFRKPESRSAKDGPGITLGAFDGRLVAKSCISSCGYLGDIDNKGKDGELIANPVTFKAARRILKRTGYSYALHTTYSSQADWPCLRFVIPFKRKIKGDADYIATQYKRVHQHFNALFGGTLDSRSSPAFFAYLPAVPHGARREFASVIIGNRPLFDPSAPLSGNAVLELPTEAADLPRVKLEDVPKLSREIKTLILKGAKERERSEALAKVYTALHHAGLSPPQIAAVCWHGDHLISDKPRENGYEWLCGDIQRVVGKLAAAEKERSDTLFKRYVYIEQQERYYDLTEHSLLKQGQFIDRNAPSFGMKRDFNAHVYWQTYWENNGGTRVDDLTYWPGAKRIVGFKGRRCLNQWSPPAAEHLVAADGEVTDAAVAPWLGLAKKLVPAKNIRNALLDWFAFVVQRPGVKCNHHPLLVGQHGIGKDTLCEPVLYGIGGGLPTAAGPSVNRVNVTTMIPGDLDRQWGYHLRSQICVTQEVVEIYSRDRRRVVNKLKPELATPPTFLRIEEKYHHPYDIPNVINRIFFSNSTKALGLERTERRFLAIHSDAQPLTKAEASAIWHWYCNGGLQRCLTWLRQRDVSNFNPKARALHTRFQDTLAEVSTPEHEQTLDRLIAAREKPFDVDLVASGDAAKFLSITNAGQYRVNGGDVSAALTQHGWTRIQRIDVAMRGYVPARLKKDALFTAPTKEGKRLAALRKQSPKALALAYYKLHGVRKAKNDNERRPK